MMIVKIFYLYRATLKNWRSLPLHMAVDTLHGFHFSHSDASISRNFRLFAMPAVIYPVVSKRVNK